MSLWRAANGRGEALDTIMRPYRDSWVATKYNANLTVSSAVFPERITAASALHYGLPSVEDRSGPVADGVPGYRVSPPPTSRTSPLI